MHIMLQRLLMHIKKATAEHSCRGKHGSDHQPDAGCRLQELSIDLAWAGTRHEAKCVVSYLPCTMQVCAGVGAQATADLP